MIYGEEAQEKDINTVGTGCYMARYEPGQDLVCASLIQHYMDAYNVHVCESYVI